MHNHSYSLHVSLWSRIHFRCYHHSNVHDKVLVYHSLTLGICVDVSYYLYCLISTHYLIITHAGIRKSIAVIMASNHLQTLHQTLLQITIHVLVSSVFKLTSTLIKALYDDWRFEHEWVILLELSLGNPNDKYWKWHRDGVVAILGVYQVVQKVGVWAKVQILQYSKILFCLIS